MGERRVNVLKNKIDNVIVVNFQKMKKSQFVNKNETKRNETNLRENNWGKKYISSLVNDITSLFQVKMAGFPHTELLKCMPSNLD